MGPIWTLIRWIIITVALLVLAGIFYFGSIETYLYATRSEDKALAAAEVVFLRRCSEKELDAHSFAGPEKEKMIGAEYSFIWKRAPEEWISVSVTYLPFDVSDSMSVALAERYSPKPRQ